MDEWLDDIVDWENAFDEGIRAYKRNIDRSEAPFVSERLNLAWQYGWDTVGGKTYDD